MEAGRELDRLIAERLGVHPVEDPCAPDGFDKWVLKDGKGHYACRAFERYATPEQAWRGMLYYSEDIYEAVNAPLPEGAVLELLIASDGSAMARVCLPISYRQSKAAPEWEHAATPELAIWRAWLAFGDREDADR